MKYYVAQIVLSIKILPNATNEEEDDSEEASAVLKVFLLSFSAVSIACKVTSTQKCFGEPLPVFFHLKYHQSL